MNWICLLCKQLRLLSALIAATAVFAALADEPLVVFIGDSLTEGYGVERSEAFPAVIEKRLHEHGKNWKIQNSGIGGSTSASAVGRVRWALKAHPRLIVLEVGSNDMLRGLKAADLEKHLNEAVEAAVAAHVPVILCGTDVPTNYGRKYSDEIHGAFDRVAKKYKLVLIRSILEGVAARPELNQTDGIHPNAKGHSVIADHLLPVLEKALP